MNSETVLPSLDIELPFLSKIVHWALLASARASYLLAKSAVVGGSALNPGSYKWQATSCSDSSPCIESSEGKTL